MTAGQSIAAFAAANPIGLGIIGGLIGNYLNIKLFSGRLLAIITSLLVIFVATRMGFKIFF